MWVAQEGGSGCVPAVGSAVRCLRVIWSGRRRAVGGALSFHNTHASPAQNTIIGFEFGTNFVLIRSCDLEFSNPENYELHPGRRETVISAMDLLIKEAESKIE